MSKKGITAGPQLKAEQENAREPELELAVEQEPAVEQGQVSLRTGATERISLEDIREHVLDIVRELRLDVDRTLGDLRREMTDRHRELRQELKLMGDERVRFFHRIEDLLQDAMSLRQGTEPGGSEMAVSGGEEELAMIDQTEQEDWLTAQQEAEQAVVGDPPVEIEGLDGKDPVQEAEAVIQECLETVMTSGGSHVEKVFRQVHGIGVPRTNNA